MLGPEIAHWQEQQFESRRGISCCAAGAAGHYCCPPNLGCGCSSVVEHLLAKEDVASSSLVTRSSLRFPLRFKRGLERHAAVIRHWTRRGESPPEGRASARPVSPPFAWTSVSLERRLQRERIGSEGHDRLSIRRGRHSAPQEVESKTHPSCISPATYEYESYFARLLLLRRSRPNRARTNSHASS